MRLIYDHNNFPFRFDPYMGQFEIAYKKGYQTLDERNNLYPSKEIDTKFTTIRTGNFITALSNAAFAYAT